MNDQAQVESPAASVVRMGLVLVAWAVVVASGLWLLRDATTYALRPSDPATGRPRGCYTALDLALGLHPSEGGILTGTRALELLLSLPAVLYGSFLFARRLWRSVLEIPLIGLAAGWGTWLAGKAFFWRFHDTDVYLTWRVIGNTPNERAETAIALVVVGLNALAVGWIWRGLSNEQDAAVRSLRSVAYSGLLSFIVALLLRVCTFPGIALLLLFALPALFIPVLVMLAHRQRVRAPD